MKGGRRHPKLADQIFKSQHNLLAPSAGQETSIFIEDNPSKDFFFPVTAEQVRKTLEKLPKEHSKELTHVWFRKVKRTDYQNGNAVQGSFISGSGVNLIVLHPFPNDLKMRFGDKKPELKQLKFYAPYTTQLGSDENGWFLKWEVERIKDYYLERLLLHEIGHHIDSMYHRFWSKAYKQKAENFADNYAVVWSNSETVNVIE